MFTAPAHALRGRDWCERGGRVCVNLCPKKIIRWSSATPIFCYQKVGSKTLYNLPFSIYFINFQLVNLGRQAFSPPVLMPSQT